MKEKHVEIENGELRIPAQGLYVIGVRRDGTNVFPHRAPWPDVGPREALFNATTGFPDVVAVAHDNSTVPQREFAWWFRDGDGDDSFTGYVFIPSALPVELTEVPPPVELPRWLQSHLGEVATFRFPFRKPKHVAFVSK